MDNDAIAGREARRDFRLLSGPVTDGHDRVLRPVSSNPIDGPLLAAAEERGRRDLDRHRGLPNDDAHLDPVGIPERGARLLGFDEVEDHVYALLFDAERLDLRESGRFDTANDCLELVVAAPLADDGASARFYPDGVGRQKVRDDLESRRIADLE